MNEKVRRTGGISVLISLLFCTVLFISPVSALQSKAVVNLDADELPVLQQLQEAGGAGLRISYHQETGKVRFVGAAPSKVIERPKSLSATASPREAAASFVSEYGRIFGLTDPPRELSVIKEKTTNKGQSFVRYQQKFQEIPVLGGELIVQIGSDNNLQSANGEILPDPDVNTVPAITAEAARRTALQKIAKDYGREIGGLEVTDPELWIYNPALLGGPGPRIDTLVWRMEVKNKGLVAIRELVLVDAQLGSVALSFSRIDTVKDRNTYDAENGTTLPGTLRCDESDPTCSAGDTHEVAAHLYSGLAYDFYFTEHGRDSVDNAGMALVSTVHYDSGYNNAFWNGAQMVYGDGQDYPLAEDVVVHEITHGVTEHESNLFYYYQSGAISESLSDVWGEFVDLYYDTSNDAGDTPWQMGEDTAPSNSGALRDMADPTLFGDPDRMSSANYYCSQSELSDGAGDNGGVHTNSGVNNKAAYLMTVGDTFNGYVVTGLGYAMVADLYYYVQTNLLTSGSDYADLYDALLQASISLGWSAADRQEVQDALNAVEMNQAPSSCDAPEAPICDTGSPSHLFFDDIESGGGNWTAGANSGSSYWFVPQTTSIIGLAAPYSTSGVGNIWGFSQGDPVGGASDTFLSMNSDVSIPADAYMHFNHSYGFESTDQTGTSGWDGGVLEYSTDSGSTWTDAGSLITENGYNGTLNSGNPLGTVSAFCADSRGYISSRLDLSSLAGQNVRFRFRIGTDSTVYDYGWFIDDVRIYTCSASAAGTPSSITVPAGDNDGSYTVSWGASATASVTYELEEATNASFTTGLRTAYSGSSTSAAITGRSDGKTYYYRVKATRSGYYDSAWKTGANGCTVSFPTAGTPSSITVPAGDNDGSYTVSWGASATASVTYELEEATNASFTTGLRTAYSGSSTSAAITGRSDGKTYYYRVKATRSGYYDSAWKTGANGCTVSFPTAGTPSSITVPAGDNDGSYTVSWGASATASVTYELEEATNAGFTTGLRTAYSGSSTSAAITGRSDGKTYYYRVKATRSGYSDSAWKTGGNGCTVSFPTAGTPSSISVPAGDNDGSYTVSWKASATSSVTYELEEAINSGFTTGLRTAYSGSSTSAAITGRSDGKTYYYRVKATRSGYNDSAWKTGTNGCTVSLPTSGDFPWSLFMPAIMANPSGSYKLPDTGQTTSYTATFGEDSDYTINPPSYTDNGDGTVTDNITGLVWQQEDDNTTYNWYEASGTFDATYNPGGTVDVCGFLTTGGYTDWRLPTDMELVTLVNYGTYNPSINTTSFPGTNSSGYWSSTSFALNSTRAWYVNFYDGGVSPSPLSPSSSYSYARCVRGGQ